MPLSSPSPPSFPSPALSSTGLFPTSRRNEQDALSSPENWKSLPPRPRPEVYRFRGDSVVNRRRRRRHHGSATGGGVSGKYGGRSTSVARPAPAAAPAAAGLQDSENEDENNENRSQAEWDDSQWHSSCHRLNREEEDRQANVRNSSLSHLRARASRRTKLLAMQRRLELEIRQEDREDEEEQDDDGDDDEEEEEEQEENGEVQILSMKQELVDNDELSTSVEAAMNIHAPVQVRLHTPCKVAPTTSMATAGPRGGQTPQQEQKKENQKGEEEDDDEEEEDQPQEEEVPSLHNLTAQVKKLESRLQNLGDNSSNSGEQEIDDVSESTRSTISTSGQQGDLLNDMLVSLDDTSSSSPSNGPRPPLQMCAESSGLPGHQYHPTSAACTGSTSSIGPLNQNDREGENLFSDAVVGSFLEALKHT